MYLQLHLDGMPLVGLVAKVYVGKKNKLIVWNANYNKMGGS